nr:glycoside hydrolase family 95 protein [Paenibacillus hamazuiensis]
MWYRNPAKKWTEALPLGNGKLGAMIFGKVEEELIQLNEDSVWYGGRRDRLHPDAAAHLPEIRRMLMEGQIAEAQYLARMALTPVPKFFGPYQPLGDLQLWFERHGGAYSDYERELDLDTAAVRVRYRMGDVAYRRDMFASAADQVIVLQFTADRPGSLSFSANLSRRPFDGDVNAGDGRLVMSGQCGPDGVRYAACLGMHAEGGTVRTIGSFVAAERADRVTLVLAAETTFRSADPDRVARERVEAALAKGAEALWRDHIAEYQPQFRRTELELGGAEAALALPTDERLARVQGGEDDPGLVALYTQYGRYLLLASSRPGGLPANLQGIWNDQFKPPWECNYTMNINLQMNYWPAEVLSLAECSGPLFDFIDRLMENGRRTAKDMYGCRGFVAHHNSDLWADTVLNGLNVRAATWPTAGAWLALHLWEHFRYGGSEEFLDRRAYPVLKEAALFFLDYMTTDKDGCLVTGPSASPENKYLLPDGSIGYLTMGPTMDVQIIGALFRSCIEASAVLRKDEAFADELRRALERFPEPKIGRHGQLLEWREEYEEAEPGHRHISHLFALHPDEAIDVIHTPELARAARTTLERRLSHGGGHTGWSRAWIINFWARLGDGEEAHRNVLALLRHSTNPNLFDEHPPFQIDGNFGGAAGVAEMLLQSHGGELRFLPALPAAWPNGHIRGLRARGALDVDLAWRDGRLAEAVLRARRSGMCRIRSSEPIAVSSGGAAVAVRHIENGLFEFAVHEGTSYVVASARERIPLT